MQPETVPGRSMHGRPAQWPHAFSLHARHPRPAPRRRLRTGPGSTGGVRLRSASDPRRSGSIRCTQRPCARAGHPPTALARSAHHPGACPGSIHRGTGEHAGRAGGARHHRNHAGRLPRLGERLCTRGAGRRHPPADRGRHPGPGAVATARGGTGPRPARIHPPALGLPGQRRVTPAYCAGTRAAPPVRRRAGRGSAALRRARQRGHGHLGHGEQLWPQLRQLPHRGCAGHPRLRRAPQRMGPARAAGRVAHRGPGRHRGRRAHRLLGRGHGAHAVSALGVPCPCGGCRRGRAARHLGQRARRGGVHGQLPVPFGLEER